MAINGTILLEDHFQDFLEFAVINNEIVETRPCQGWLWNKGKIKNITVQKGDLLVLSMSGNDNYILKYPVKFFLEAVNNEDELLPLPWGIHPAILAAAALKNEEK